MKGCFTLFCFYLDICRADLLLCYQVPFPLLPLSHYRSWTEFRLWHYKKKSTPLNWMLEAWTTPWMWWFGFGFFFFFYYQNAVFKGWYRKLWLIMFTSFVAGRLPGKCFLPLRRVNYKLCHRERGATNVPTCAFPQTAKWVRFLHGKPRNS